jgi:RsiW-degrading membrane proteinase PrsW (M82 family)
MGFILSVFFGIVPMLFFAWILYWIDRYEKEPKILLGGVFLWGAMVSAGLAFVVNTILGVGVYLVTGSEAFTDLATGSLVAPPVEESLKGMAVLLVFLLFHHEFDSILDGIVYAGIAALGFAATENIYYIYNYGFLENGYTGLFWLVFVRVILVGWQHPFYTAFIGIGLAMARFQRNTLLKLILPVIGWGIAITAHSIHNTIATFASGLGGMALGTFIDWSGWLLMLIFILWSLARERKWIRMHLREEVSRGIISPAQYKTACSAGAQSAARLSALFTGRYRATSRFYNLTAELAYKKQQRARMGEEGDNSERIRKARAALARLSPVVRA